MGVLKGIGYIMAAIVVLTVLVSGGFMIVIAAIVIGLLLDLVGVTLFTAAALRAYFGSDKHSDTK